MLISSCKIPFDANFDLIPSKDLSSPILLCFIVINDHAGDFPLSPLDLCLQKSDEDFNDTVNIASPEI
jgi:hypothetical protein